jgi:CheY-like chemotaxis protein
MNPEETRILMVDDDPFVRDMVGFILQSNDYIVETADNGLEALEKFQRGSAHVIITDMHMPEMDGLTLIQEVRKTDPDIAIILMTGNDDASAVAKGADECIVKDENIQDTIVASVEAILKKKGLRN